MDKTPPCPKLHFGKCVKYAKAKEYYDTPRGEKHNARMIRRIENEAKRLRPWVYSSVCRARYSALGMTTPRLCASAHSFSLVFHSFLAAPQSGRGPGAFYYERTFDVAFAATFVRAPFCLARATAKVVRRTGPKEDVIEAMAVFDVGQVKLRQDNGRELSSWGETLVAGQSTRAPILPDAGCCWLCPPQKNQAQSG